MRLLDRAKGAGSYVTFFRDTEYFVAGEGGMAAVHDHAGTGIKKGVVHATRPSVLFTTIY